MTCASCGARPPTPGGGRRLCEACRCRHQRAGTLIEFPRVTTSWDEIAGDLELLRERYPRATVRELAQHLGMSYAALDQALYRARRRVRDAAVPDSKSAA